MKVVITGGTGFIGRMLARRILELGSLTGPSGQPEPVDELLLFDAVEPAEPLSGRDERAKLVVGNLADGASASTRSAPSAASNVKGDV